MPEIPSLSVTQLTPYTRGCGCHIIRNTEMSYARASAEYGQFFRDMVRAGKMRPVRVGNGKNGTRWFSARDILALRMEEEGKAKII